MSRLFNNLVLRLTENNFKLVEGEVIPSNYKDKGVKLKIQCLSCKEVLDRSFLATYGKMRCDYCGKGCLKEDKAHELLKDKGFKILTKFVNKIDYYDYQCLSCGSIEYNKRFNSFIIKGFCRGCERHPKGLTDDQIIDYLGSINFKPVDVDSYKNNNTAIECECKLCGNIESIKLVAVQQGKKKQCTFCSKTYKYGEFPDKPHIAYYIKVDDANVGYPLYKVGITAQSVRKRFSRIGDWEKITVLDTRIFETGSSAYEYEQKVLKDFGKYKYKGKRVLNSKGNTELFTTDILGLDQ